MKKKFPCPCCDETLLFSVDENNKISVTEFDSTDDSKKKKKKPKGKGFNLADWLTASGEFSADFDDVDDDDGDD